MRSRWWVTAALTVPLVLRAEDREDQNGNRADQHEGLHPLLVLAGHIHQAPPVHLLGRQRSRPGRRQRHQRLRRGVACGDHLRHRGAGFEPVEQRGRPRLLTVVGDWPAILRRRDTLKATGDPARVDNAYATARHRPPGDRAAPQRPDRVLPGCQRTAAPDVLEHDGRSAGLRSRWRRASARAGPATVHSTSMHATASKGRKPDHCVVPTAPQPPAPGPARRAGAWLLTVAVLVPGKQSGANGTRSGVRAAGQGPGRPRRHRGP